MSHAVDECLNVDPSGDGCVDKNSLPISAWNVEGVNSFAGLFEGKDKFNQNITSWNVDGVKWMDRMFYGASAFNQDIGSWNTKGVTRMEQMFYNAKRFDKDITSWDADVQDGEDMFKGADAWLAKYWSCLLYTSPSPRDRQKSRMPSSA